MATKKPKNHTEAPDKIDLLRLKAMPHGGFAVDVGRDDCGYGLATLAAFSTLDEMLAWLKANVGLPVKAGSKAVGR